MGPVAYRIGGGGPRPGSLFFACMAILTSKRMTRGGPVEPGLGFWRSAAHTMKCPSVRQLRSVPVRSQNGAAPLSLEADFDFW